MTDFFIPFSGNEPIFLHREDKLRLYMNMGNVSEHSWVSWNAVPYDSRLKRIKVCVSPGFDTGDVRFSIVKNSKVQQEGVLIPEGLTTAEADLDLEFRDKDYIALTIDLNLTTGKSWPSAMLIFERT